MKDMTVPEKKYQNKHYVENDKTKLRKRSRYNGC